MGGGLMGRGVAMRLIFRQTDLGARRPFKHPRRNLQPTLRIGAGDIALEHQAARPIDRRQPVTARLAPNFHINARRIIARRCGRLTIGIGATVDRILHHSVDSGVVRTPPCRSAILAFYRQLEIVLEEPEQSLPRAAELQNFVEDETDGFLDATIGILLVTIARLDEAAN